MSQPGRNDPCPCGSGKKYKYCCMAADKQRHYAAVSAAITRRLAIVRASSLRIKEELARAATAQDAADRPSFVVAEVLAR